MKELPNSQNVQLPFVRIFLITVEHVFYCHHRAVWSCRYKFLAKIMKTIVVIREFDIFSLTLSSTGFSLLQTMRSGEIPRPRNSLTLACVGFVLCSPVAFGWGTKDTWTEQKFSRPTRNWNWRNASTNGIPSISPMVPPSSMIHNYEAKKWMLTENDR